jgi:hypothetical protein
MRRIMRLLRREFLRLEATFGALVLFPATSLALRPSWAVEVIWNSIMLIRFSLDEHVFLGRFNGHPEIDDAFLRPKTQK